MSSHNCKLRIRIANVYKLIQFVVVTSSLCVYIIILCKKTSSKIKEIKTTKINYKKVDIKQKKKKNIRKKNKTKKNLSLKKNKNNLFPKRNKQKKIGIKRALHLIKMKCWIFELN